MASVYSSLETVLNTTRARVNDAILGIGGNTMQDNSGFTGYYVNVAWRKLQNKLRAVGFTGFARLKDDLVIASIPSSASSDPGVQNYIAWNGFFNGVTLTPGPALPPEFIAPLVLWERPNQAANTLQVAQNFRLMDRTLNGIPTNGPKQSRNLNWDWRNDVIAFPGSTIAWDLRIRCLTMLPDLAPNGVIVDPTTTLVPIVDCLDPLSALIAYEFSSAREDLDAKSFMDEADEAIAQIYSRDTAQMTGVQTPAQYGQMKGPYTPSLTPLPTQPAAPQGGNPQ